MQIIFNAINSLFTQKHSEIRWNWGVDHDDEEDEERKKKELKGGLGIGINNIDFLTNFH